MENEERNITTCYDCGCEIDLDNDEYTEIDGEYICSDCREDYFVCDDCGEYARNDDCIETADGQLICRSCYGDHYFMCHDCDGVYNLNDSTYIEDMGYDVCENCRDDYYYCDECGEWVSSDNIHCVNDRYICDGCYDEDDYRVICGYHDRDLPIEYLYTENDLTDDTIYATKDTEKNSENMFKMGMEIEVENRANTIDNDEMARKIREKFPHLKLVFEGDGSLCNGFEIITQPMTMSYIREHKEDFKEICKMLSDNGFQSHNGGHCGQHIHFSRTYLQNDEDKYVKKLLLFFERYKKEIYTFSRRESARWCAWVSDNANYEPMYYKSSKILCDYAKSNMGHGVAINLENRNTIEIRVFRGTLKYETMMSNFEFVNSLIHIIKEKPTRQINFDKVINYSGNEFIQGYCSEKNIYNSEFMSDETTNIFKQLQDKKDRYENVKEDVKNNIEIVVGEMVELTKKIVANIPTLTKENESDVKRLLDTSMSIQNLISNNINFLNDERLQKDETKIEDNYRQYINGNRSYDYNRVLEYYRNIRNYIPKNDYTEELTTKMDNVIKSLEEKYANRLGAEI